MSTPLIHQNTIIAPVITEKSYGLAKLNKYAFKVAPSASKSQIKKAIKDLFNVDVLSINTVKKASRRVRSMKTGRHLNTPVTKKAIVELKKGQTIYIFNALKS
ncbi:50S ribosomal protein L23 [Candidatus Collierbacteria bacterium RIFOXYD1_FULL_40_9]|uniref:Large ribosomal subunit protein uL23 n=1 Tax=Candidatus Collierbacteria bacterium RIFOXYD1_FULL_40_9 TaxID=1817731 RepID=A0A1F5FWH6_9BACT|nr:MAG: 50S ribosomal protein L23 [Candidatus Collierbacteria bacterium RIFOXYD1_FULL_40_9]